MNRLFNVPAAAPVNPATSFVEYPRIAVGAVEFAIIQRTRREKVDENRGRPQQGILERLEREL
jgi:hypothetical protein